jgi:calcineurin-like phosphoesterase family protein
MNFSEKLVAFLNNNNCCMTTLKITYNNPYRQYSHERGHFYETEIIHYPKMSGVTVKITIRKFETHSEVHNIELDIYGIWHWQNECPTVNARRERLIKFLSDEIKASRK